MPEAGFDPVKILRCNRLLAAPADPWREEPTLEQVFWQGLWPRGGPTLEQFVKNCIPWEGVMLEKFMDCLP